jgi:hypothetical protein
MEFIVYLCRWPTSLFLFLTLTHFSNIFNIFNPFCNVPDLASLGNTANVCVGSMVYNI